MLEHDRARALNEAAAPDYVHRPTIPARRSRLLRGDGARKIAKHRPLDLLSQPRGDRNRDGHLDPSEFTTVRRAGTAFAEADFGYFDENQDGKITRSEFVDKPSEFILRFDKNGDCRVTQDEMKGARRC